MQIKKEKYYLTSGDKIYKGKINTPQAQQRIKTNKFAYLNIYFTLYQIKDEYLARLEQKKKLIILLLNNGLIHM